MGQNDTFSRNTCNQLTRAFDLLRELMPPPDPLKWPIGSINSDDKDKKTLEQGKRRR